jgi:hypothetical protein
MDLTATLTFQSPFALGEIQIGGPTQVIGH